MRLEHLRCPLRMLLMNSPVLKRDCSYPVHLLNFDHSFFMNVPNIQEIAHDQISPLIANSAGDSQPLVVAMIRGQERERARILKGIHDEISPHLLKGDLLLTLDQFNPLIPARISSPTPRPKQLLSASHGRLLVSRSNKVCESTQ
jgi:hypothetical protein